MSGDELKQNLDILNIKYSYYIIDNGKINGLMLENGYIHPIKEESEKISSKNYLEMDLTSNSNLILKNKVELKELYYNFKQELSSIFQNKSKSIEILKNIITTYILNPVIPIEIKRKKIYSIFKQLTNKIFVNKSSILKTKGKVHFKKKLANYFMKTQENWLIFKKLDSDGYLMLRTHCKNCGELWDREEKECYKCKVWQPPLVKCYVCNTLQANDVKDACPICARDGFVDEKGEPIKFKKICIQCGFEEYNDGNDAKENMDSTYFVPITFCQKCGCRENIFEFKDLK